MAASWCPLANVLALLTSPQHHINSSSDSSHGPNNSDASLPPPVNISACLLHGQCLMSVCLCVTSSDRSSTCSLQPCSEITSSIRWHYCDSQCRSLLMHVVHIKCTYTFSSQCCWEQKSYLNNTNCLIKHVKRTPHSSKHGQHQTHLSECSSRMQKKEACRIMRHCSI